MRKLSLLVALFLLVMLPSVAGAQGRPQIAPHTVAGVLDGSLTFVVHGPAIFDVYSLGVATGPVKGLGMVTLFTFHEPTEQGTVVNGRAFLVAANGDRINTTYEGTTEIVDPEHLLGKATLVITGGTGRFAKAAGTLEMTVHIVFAGFDTFEWPASWLIEGTIEY